ncbi:MAG: glyoxalase [Flavobacterium sp.]
MTTRDNLLLQLRGATIGITNDNNSEEENFQNQTLRPILKIQNDLLLAVFSNYINSSKIDFNQFKNERKIEFITQSLQKDIPLRNNFKGLVIGFFTQEEFETYKLNASNLNKRMMTMLVERLKSQLEYFVQKKK